MFDKAWPLALGRLESSTGVVVLTRLSQPRADAETKTTRAMVSATASPNP